jgi:hypothetical protein
MFPIRFFFARVPLAGGSVSNRKQAGNEARRNPFDGEAPGPDRREPMNVLMKTGSIYHGIPPEQDEPLTITGRNLAHSTRTKAARAFVAADLHLGRCRLTNPTVAQAARLAHVCTPYVAAAIALADDAAARAAVLAGDRTLVDAARRGAPECLAEHFARCTPAEWLECARTVGAAAIWDHMVVPLV